MSETLSQLIRNTREYSDVCDMCKDEILIYPIISGRTEYTQDEVEQITLKRIIDKLQAKEQEYEELKAYAQRQENQRETYYKEFLKKDKALEEIEGIIKSSTKDFNHIDWEAKAFHALTTVDKISDIINKAKGE